MVIISIVIIIMIFFLQDADHYLRHKNKCHDPPSSHCGSSTWSPGIIIYDDDEVADDDGDDDDIDDDDEVDLINDASGWQNCIVFSSPLDARLKMFLSSSSKTSSY